MKVSLYIVRDTWNSYPVDELEISIEDKVVSICIKGEKEREISVYKKEFARIARLCEEEVEKGNAIL